MGDLPSKDICEGELIDPVTNTQITVITPKSDEIQDQSKGPSQPVNDPLLHLALATEVIDPASIPDEMLQPEGSDVQSDGDFHDYDRHSEETETADETFETADSQLTKERSSQSTTSLDRTSRTSSDNHSPNESHDAEESEPTLTEKGSAVGEEQEEAQEGTLKKEHKATEKTEGPALAKEQQTGRESELETGDTKAGQEPEGGESEIQESRSQQVSDDWNYREVPIHVVEDTTFPSFIRVLEVVEEEWSDSETCSEIPPYLVEEFEEDINMAERRLAEELNSSSPVPNSTCYRIIVQEFDSEEMHDRRQWGPNSDNWLDDFWILQGSTDETLQAFEKLEAELYKLARKSTTPTTASSDGPSSNILSLLPPEFRLKVLDKFLSLPVINGVADLTEIVYSEAKHWSPTPIRICWNLSEKVVSAAMGSLAWLSRPLHKPIHHLDDLICKLMNTVANRSFEF